MDIKSIKKLASEYAQEELFGFADELEETGVAPVKTQDDPGDQMSDYLQAAEVLQIMKDEQIDLNTAVRNFAKRVRAAME